METSGADDPILESFRLSAELVGIHFSEEEFVRLKPQFAQMLKTVRVLRELDLADVEPALTFLPLGMAKVEGK